MCIHCHNGDFKRDAKIMAILVPLLIIGLIVWAVLA